jgi:DNA primase
LIGNIHLTPQLVQAVRDAVDIVDIASEYTKLTKAGRRYKGLCPIHKEKTPSFSVEPDQGLFYCFGCGQGGDAIKLHQTLSGDDFPAAIETLARRYGIPLPKATERRGGRREPDLERVLEEANGFFQDQLRKTPRVVSYLERRKIPSELIERFGVGYAPDGWRNLVGALGGRFPMKELEAAGLASRSEKRPDEPFDRFRHRLMFPIRNATGRLVGFGGRTLGDDRAKYINTAETARFQKSYLLYGLDLAKRAIRDEGRAFLVEGYFDVLGAVAAGIETSVASMGTALTPEQARLLKRFAEDVVVGYDGDSAGQQATRRALSTLLSEGLTVRRPALPEGEDPDSLRRKQGDEVLLELVDGAEDAVMLEIRRLVPDRVRTEPSLQARSAKRVAELLKPIPDGILRYSYARIAADRLGVPVDLLWRRVGGERGGTAPETPPAPRSEVRSLEERTLQLLLAPEVKAPPLAELPPEEAFFDADLRNIFSTFCALYGEAGENRPEVKAVLASVGSQGKAVDQLARLLLQEPVAEAKGELQACLAGLRRRWQQQRLRELSTEISRAQSLGDTARLERLLQEKNALSRDLHGRDIGSGGQV